MYSFFFAETDLSGKRIVILRLRNKNPALTRGMPGSMLSVSAGLYHDFLLLNTSYLTLEKYLIVRTIWDV